MKTKAELMAELEKAAERQRTANQIAQKTRRGLTPEGDSIPASNVGTTAAPGFSGGQSQR